jgi:hypothetical protein
VGAREPLPAAGSETRAEAASRVRREAPCAPPFDVLAACYVPTGHVLTGQHSGEIMVWQGSRAEGRTQAYGRAQTGADGGGQWGLRNGGCTALCPHRSHHDRVLSAGCADGASGLEALLIDWRIQPRVPREHDGLATIELVPLRCFRVDGGGGPWAGHRMVVGLDWHGSDPDRCLVGDVTNDVYELQLLPAVADDEAAADDAEGGADEAAAGSARQARQARQQQLFATATAPSTAAAAVRQQLVEGQPAAVFGVAAGPRKAPETFVTVRARFRPCRPARARTDERCCDRVRRAPTGTYTSGTGRGDGCCGSWASRGWAAARLGGSGWRYGAWRSTRAGPSSRSPPAPPTAAARSALRAPAPVPGGRGPRRS